MAKRTLTIDIVGDPSSASRALRKTGDEAEKTGKKVDGAGKRFHGFATVSSSGFSRVGVAARGMSVGVGAAAVGVGFLTKQFVESQKVSKQTDAVLKSTGHAAGVTSKQVSDLATAISRKTGVDDEAVQSGENLLLTFTKIHNQTGKGNAIFTRATKVATDMSAALGQDMKSSAIQVGKALNDPIKGVTALQRVGVSFTQKQKDQIKALVDSGKAMDAQKLILRELNKEFGGSAAAQATPFDKLKVSAGNLAETLGGYLAPTLGKAAGALNKFLNQMQSGKGTGGAFVRTIVNTTSTLKGAWQSAVSSVRRFLNRHEEDIRTAGQALRNLGRAAKYVFETIIIPVFRVALRNAGRIFDAFKDTLAGLIRFVTNVLAGKWGKAWDALKDTVKNTFRLMFNIVRGSIETLGTLALKLGGVIVKGVVKGLGKLGDAIYGQIKKGINSAADKAKDLINKVNPFGDIGDGIGKSIGDGVGIGAGGRLPQGGAFGGSLMGARPAMRPFAAIGASFGLQVSSGRRPGAITSSGNQSWHSTGEAIDEAGSPSGMLGYFKTLRSRYGPRLAELIYTPGGVGIKDGRPYRYTGQVAADHYDHVHVAFDSGRRGLGDGIGQIRSLWTRAGGSPSAANMAAAIAMAESGGRPGASHRNSDGSIDRGLWQINSVHGSLSTFDRLANARAAVSISHGGRDWSAWTTYTSGAYRRFLGAGGKARSGGGAPSRPKHTVGTAGPSIGGFGGSLVGAPSYEQSLTAVGLDVATATAKDDLPSLISALTTELSIKRARLRRLRKLLKRKHRYKPATRAKWQEEATQLVADIKDLSDTLKEYRADAKGGATTISAAEGLNAGVNPDAPTPADFANLAIAEAALTPGTADDLTALQGLLGVRQGELAAARASGDPRKILDALNAVTEVNKSIQDLTAAVTDLKQQQLDVAAELKKYNDFAASVEGIATKTAIKALADVMSGEVVGRNLQGRRLTAGNGATVALP